MDTVEKLPDFLKRTLYKISEPNDNDWIIAVSKKGAFLVGGTLIPTWKLLKGSHLGDLYCFIEHEHRRWIFCTDSRALENDPQFQNVALRAAATFLRPLELAPLFIGSHLQHWLARTLYCGQCGKALKDHHNDHARICSSCESTFYPKISPCIIVAIRKNNKILLARSPHHASGRYTAIAGFVEAGEALEAAVHREVDEELGLQVKHIKYFGSQPWPFPDSLMIGFIAEYAGGELRIDPKELEDAQWFGKEALPDLPPPISISRQLIDFCVSTL